MKFVLKIIIVINLATFAGVLSAQDCPPIGPPFTSRPPGVNCRMFGKTQVDSFQGTELTSASMRTHLIGKPNDIVPAENAWIRVLNDVLIMRLAFFAPRNVTPQSAYLELTSYSSVRSKHERDNKLTISLDGNPLFSENMQLQSSIGVGECFLLEIKYADFLRIMQAKNITIHFGETRVDLSIEAIDALNSLQITTKNLRTPPPSWM